MPAFNPASLNRYPNTADTNKGGISLLMALIMPEDEALLTRENFSAPDWVSSRLLFFVRKFSAE
jgi:hypothetical protein